MYVLRYGETWQRGQGCCAGAVVLRVCVQHEQHQRTGSVMGGLLLLCCCLLQMGRDWM